MESDAGAAERKKRVRLPAVERRRQFVEIAFDLIAEKGLEGLRFQDVAAQAGVNSATLLHQFPSKEDLIQAVVRFVVEEKQAEPNAPGGQAGNAAEELRQEFEGLGQFIEEDPGFFVVLTEIGLRARRDDAVAALVVAREQFRDRRLGDILRRGIAEGVFRRDLDVETAILSLTVQIKGIAHHAALSPGAGERLSSVIGEICEQVLLRLV
ncbi:MAG TPA: TetR/AcrR family transcriptional regulator [Terracidiphilus sp.]|jgi:AcrR family transcriptional regulator|nr:TetR/AcrR family transcriptional regulator [Terracidiphilus sp.]